MSHHEPVQILLVDDQPGKLMAYEAMLADLGEHLVRASSAAEALEHLLKTEFAVVLIDVCMPELDGFELASMIRAHPRYRNTAIILVSAVLVNDIHRLKGYHAGAVDYVGVPVVPEILRAKVAVFADLYRKTRRLERMNEELEVRVQERTAELMMSDRRKDEFIALLGHELRNPLAPMRNSVHLLRQTSDPAHRAQAVDVLDRQLAHLVRLVDDLLDIGRITTGKLELRTRCVGLAEVLHHAVETIQPDVARKGQELALDLGTADVNVDGDPMRLTQIFANLLQNASKFTDAGGHIWLSMRAHDDTVEIRVRDDGDGIAPELLSNIYDMFSQGDRSLERRQGGLGIGLTMVKRLVEMHHGTVVGRSKGRGCGSEFTVTLPRAVRPSTRPPRAEAPMSAPAARRILVADDNPDSLESLAMVLRSHGNEVRTAIDGVEAVALAEAFRPEVVVLDVGMPRMNGYDACSRIREQEWGRNVLLIALTGWGQDEDRRRSQEVGFHQHFVKPVEPDQLIGYLARHAAMMEELRAGPHRADADRATH